MLGEPHIRRNQVEKSIVDAAAAHELHRWELQAFLVDPYRTGGGEGRWLFFLEFLNLLNRDNTLVVNPVITFDGGRPFVREELVSSIPLMPNLGIRLRF